MAKWEQTRRIFRVFTTNSAPLRVIPCKNQLLLLRKRDCPDAARHLDVNGYGRLAVELVGVLVAVMLEAACANRAEPTRGVDDHADIFRQADVGLANAALDVGGKIGLAIAR